MSGKRKPAKGAPKRKDAGVERAEALRDVKHEAFLAALCEGRSVYAAAQAAGLGRSSVYRHRAENEAFAAAWDEAVECGTDTLEDEARRRAFEGVEEPVFYKGEVVGHVRKYSDTLLMQQLNARRPEKYRQNHKVEHSGAVAITIAPDDAAL